MHNLTPPFSIALPDTNGAGELHCRQAVRTLTGRRLVCAGSWQGRNVYAKLFFNTRKAKRDWQRELRGINYLQAAGIPTPPLLYAGFLPDSQCYLLVLGAIAPAATLNQLWAKTTSCRTASATCWCWVLLRPPQRSINYGQRPRRGRTGKRYSEPWPGYLRSITTPG